MEKKINIKKTAVIVLPVVFALIATIAIALLVGGGQRSVSGDSELPEGSSTPQNVEVVAPPDDKTEDGSFSEGDRKSVV